MSSLGERSARWSLADERGEFHRDVLAALLVVGAVGVAFGVRLTAQPLVGEETRWATAAREMLLTGDWVVPRQQGQVFAERPPMTIWLMAVGGYLRGDVDAVAARLPSIVAVVLTSLVVFTYTRAFAARTAAVASALGYATFGQVVMIGRMGESEAVFALFVSASLLVWHVGYVKGWRPIVVWSVGFALAALGAMVKGPQAPAYFGAITVVYLLSRRDWRYLLSWQAVVGGCLFLAIIAVWQVPFYRATNWQTVVGVWAGLAGDRLRLSGMITHAFSYPAETFACLLPWSPMLIALARRDVRARLSGQSAVVGFLVTAMLVAYPTVWFAAGARGRYFMPLYPLTAVLIGITIECCATAASGTVARRAWQQFVGIWAVLIAACGLVVAVSTVLPENVARIFNQPPAFALGFAVSAAAVVAVLWRTGRSASTAKPIAAVFALFAIIGLGGVGIVINMHVADWSDPTAAVRTLARHIPAGKRLVSLTAIDHRFAYFYRDEIDEIGWPTTVDELQDGVEYFCFMRHVTDTAEVRLAGRGRGSYKTSGTLPFAWEELAEICTDRQVNTPTATSVVLGRVIRPMRAEFSDATKPQGLKISQQSAAWRK